jgi:hypothetical protein
MCDCVDRIDAALRLRYRRRGVSIPRDGAPVCGERLARGER